MTQTWAHNISSHLATSPVGSFRLITTGDWWIPITKGMWRGKRLHVLTSLWYDGRSIFRTHLHYGLNDAIVWNSIMAKSHMTAGWQAKLEFICLYSYTMHCLLLWIDSTEMEHTQYLPNKCYWISHFLLLCRFVTNLYFTNMDWRHVNVYLDKIPSRPVKK